MEEQYWMITVGYQNTHFNPSTRFIDHHPVDWLVENRKSKIYIDMEILFAMQITKEQYQKAKGA